MNSKINAEGDDRLLDIRRDVAGLTVNDMIEIALIEDEHVGDIVASTLDKYEQEIVRLRAANARLKNKNRNYRTGIKSLQRAHEASLHREAAQQQTIEYLARNGGVCQIVHDDGDGPYSPVRFNNEQPVSQYANAGMID